MGFDDLLNQYKQQVKPLQATSGGGFESLLKQYQATQAVAPPTPAPQPEAPKRKAEFSPLGGLKTLATEVFDTPENIAASVVTATQGRTGAEVVAPDMFERFVNRTRSENMLRREAVEREYGEDTFLPGIKVKDVAGLSENLGFSFASMLGGGLGAIAGSIAGPVGTKVGQFAGSGASAYRSSAFDITKQFLEFKDQELRQERGSGLTKEEEDTFREEFSSAATEHGLWEAVPEAIGNVAGFGLIAGPLGKVAGKVLGKKAASEALTKFGAKFAGVKGLAAATGTELATEAVTEIGQGQNLKDTVLGDPEALDWNLADFGTALKRVAPQTLLLMGTLKGGGTAASKAVDVVEYRANAPQFQALQKEFAEEEFKKAGGGLYEVTIGEGDAATKIKGSPTLLRAVLRQKNKTATPQDTTQVQQETARLEAEQEVIQSQLEREDLSDDTREQLETAQQVNAEALEETRAVAPEAGTAPTEATKVGKIQITNQDRVDLANIGFTGADIRVMRPAEAEEILEAAKKLPTGVKLVATEGGQFQLLDTNTGSLLGDAYESKAEALQQNAVQQDTSSSTQRFIREQLSAGQTPEAVAEAVGMDMQTVLDIYNEDVHGSHTPTANEGKKEPDVAPAEPTPSPDKINPGIDILQRKLNQYLAPSGASIQLQNVSVPENMKSAVAKIEELFGKKVHFYSSSGTGREVLDINGAFLKEDSGHIFVNSETADPFATVLGHELVHALRNDNPALYAELLELTQRFYDIGGVGFDSAVDAYVAALKQAKQNEGQEVPSDAQLREEATEEMVADALASQILNGWFLSEVSYESESMFQHLMSIIAKFLSETRAKLSKSDRTLLDEIQGDIDKVVKTYAKSQATKDHVVDEEAAAQIAGEFGVNYSRNLDISIALDKMRYELAKQGQAERGPVELSGGRSEPDAGRVRAIVEGAGSRARGLFEAAGYGNEARRLATAASGFTDRLLQDGTLTTEKLESEYTRMLDSFKAKVADGTGILADITNELKAYGLKTDTSTDIVEGLLQADAAYQRFLGSGRNVQFSRKLDPLGFYSPLTDSIPSLFDQKTLTGKQLLAKLDKAKKRDQKNFKQEEIDYVGLEDYLRLYADVELTPVEVSQFVAEEGVRIEEVVIGSAQDARYKDYQLPGGEDYKEVLLTLPTRTRPREEIIAELKERAERLGVEFGTTGGLPEFADLEQELEASREERRPGGETFASSHFDQPNVLAHARVNTRELPSGERVLFIEEIQSDWNAEGRKRGFETPPQATIQEMARGEFGVFGAQNELKARGFATREEAQQAVDSGSLDDFLVSSTGVPSAPFVQSSAWQNLILKRLIRMAAEQNAQRIAWINGEQTAERYSLDKQVDYISYTDLGNGTYNVTGGKAGGTIWRDDAATESSLEATLGKEITKRIMAGEGIDFGSSMQLKGDDLKIEAQWARNLYDKAIPNFMNKFGKKYGVKVEEISLAEFSSAEVFTDGDNTYEVRPYQNTATGAIEYSVWEDAFELQTGFDSEAGAAQYIQEEYGISMLSGTESGPTTQQSLPLNEGINEDIMLHGVPLFSRPSEIAGKIQERLSTVGQQNINTIKEMVKNPLNAKLRFLPTLLKTVPLPFKVEMFEKRLPKLTKLYDHVRKYTASKDGIVTQAQTLYDAMLRAAKTPEQLEKVNAMAATASLYQVDPRKPLMQQDWIPKGLRGQAGLAAAEAAYTAAGMNAIADGKTLAQAHAEAKRQHDALSAPIRKAYSDIINDARAIRERERAAAIAQLKELEEASPEKVAELIAQIDQVFNSLKGAYLPLARFGKYIVRVKDHTGKLKYQAHYENPERMFLEQKALEGSLEGGDYTEVDLKGEAQFGQDKQVPAEFRDSIIAMAQAKFMGTIDPASEEGKAAAEQMQGFTDDLFQLWLRNVPEGSSLKNSVRRKGVAGYNADMMRSYIEYMIHHAANVAYSEEGREINRLMNDMRLDTRNKIAQEDPQALVDKVVLDDIQHHLLTARTAKTSKFAQMLGKVSLAWYLSSPSQFMVQLSQLGILTLPKLGAKYGFAKAGKYMGRALQKALTPNRYNPAQIATMDPLYNRLTQRVTPEMVANAQAQAANNERLRGMGIQPTAEDIKAAELADAQIGEPLLSEAEQLQLIDDVIGDNKYKRDLLLLKFAAAENLLDITLSHEALEVSQGNNRNGWAQHFAFFMRESELASRKAATLSAFELASDGGKNFLDAFAEAKHVNIDTLFDYSKEARPYALRANDWARVITTFQVFRISMLFKLARLMHQSFKGMDAKTKKTAQKELAGILAVVSITGGVTALPFISTFMVLLELAAGDDDEPILVWRELRNVLRNTVGEVGADVIMNGLPTAAGIDISGRVGLDSIFEPSSGPPEYMNLAQTANWGAANLLGPIWGVATDFAKGADQINKGNHLKGVGQMMPKLFRDTLKTIHVASEGVKTSQGRRILEEGALNPAELILMAVGINPNDFARANEANRDLSTMGLRISQRRGELTRHFAQAFAAEDVYGREEAIEAIREFNQAQPQFAITSAEISSLIKKNILADKAVLSVRELLLAREFDIPLYRIEGQR